MRTERPQVESGEAEATNAAWDADTHVLTVTVDHTEAGAVDFVLR